MTTLKPLTLTTETLFLPDFCSVYTLFFCVILTELLAFVLTLTSLGTVAWPSITENLISHLAMTSLFIQWVTLTSVTLLCVMCRRLNSLEGKKSNLITGLISYFTILTIIAFVSECAWWLDEMLSSPEWTSNFLDYFLVLRNSLLAILGGALMLSLIDYISAQRYQERLLLLYSGSLLAIFLLSESVVFFSTVPIDSAYAFQHQLFLLRNLAIGAIVSAIALRYLYVQYQWKKEIELATYSRWQALQAHIRPHFLFNSMNTIASLIRLHPDKAEQAVEDLSALFRASLSDAHQTTLEDELTLCQQYLRFEALRLGERLNVVWNVENLPMSIPFPPLMLQPLLENALHHGIYPRLEGGTLRVTGWTDGKQIRLEVESPLGETLAEPRGLKIAQHNTQQRLQTYFGSQAKLTVQIQADVYCVTLHFPWSFL